MVSGAQTNLKQKNNEDKHQNKHIRGPAATLCEPLERVTLPEDQNSPQKRKQNKTKKRKEKKRKRK